MAHRTPVVRCSALDRAAGSRLYLKCENFQRVGAFKFRGAYNALASLTPEQRARGVVAFSSGNHAQGVALAARLLDMKATIVMPRDADPLKLAATRGYGATIVEYDRTAESREEIATRLCGEGGAVLVPPFDHPMVIAGQGTAALELLESVPALDVLVAPLGGGGLLSGSVLAARALRPQISIVGVEPAAGDDWVRSFEAGTPVAIGEPATIADGLRTRRPGDITWPIVRANVERIVTVSDEEIAAAMRLLFERAKIVVEPSGAAPVAAALAGRLGPAGSKIGIVVSGGNVDARTFCAIVAGR